MLFSRRFCATAIVFVFEIAFPLFAEHATALGATPTASATPIATSTATPTPIGVPSLLATSTPTATASPGKPTPTMTPILPTIIPTPTLLPTATATPVPKITPAPGGLDIEPAPRLINFGMVGIQQSTTRNLTLHNRTTMAVTGAASTSNPQVYVISPMAVSVPARGSQPFTIKFAPTTQGQQNAMAAFALAGDPNEPELTVPLEGFGAPGHLAIQQRVVNFGHPKNPKTAQLTRKDNLVNNGKGLLTITIGTLTPPFNVSPTGMQTIKPRDHLTLTITYSGTPKTETLTIMTDNPSQAKQNITVEGDATFTVPTATPTPTSLPTLPATPTPTKAVATPTPTPVTLPSPLSKASPAMLFAGHGLAGAMIGSPITPRSQTLGATAQTYNPQTDSFHKAGKMNNPRVGASSTTLPNGMTLIAGGGSCVEGKDRARSCAPTNTAQLFDPHTRKFKTAGTGSNGHMNSARMGHSATLISECGCPLDGDVLLAGGNSGVESVSPDKAASDAAPLQTAELYDPRNDAFIALPNSMVSPREEAIAVAIPGDGGKVLIAGGDSKGIFRNSIADAEIFDPVTQSFTATAPMSLSRELARAVALDPSSVNGPLAGDILVTGGMSTVGNLAGSSLNSAELYDPVAGKWTTIATPMDSPRALHSMTLLTSGPAEGQVLVLGGVVLQGTGGLKNLIRNSVASAELFNPADGSFSKAASMSGPRSAHSAIMLDNGPNSGNVLVAGGQKCDGPECNAADTAAELYDPATGKWNPSKAAMTPSLGAVLGEVVAIP